MRFKRTIGLGVGLALAASFLIAVVATRQSWKAWLVTVEPNGEAKATTASSEITKIQISSQAETGLGIVPRPVRLQEYWRSIEVPGSIVDRPGESDRAVPSPAGGYVTAISARPGDTVRAGDPLFTVRVVGDLVLTTQSELRKTTKEIQLNSETKERLARPENVAVTPPARLIELDQQDQRLKAAAEGYRQILLNTGLRREQIADAEKGTFTTEIQVRVPAPAKNGDVNPSFEVQELKVTIGEPVQAGQTVFLLADHRKLYVEGRAFKQEARALASAAKEGLPVRAEFVEETPGQWPALEPLTIRHLANAVDPVSRTFAFYLPLANHSESYMKDGQTFLTWRFRPGQRVRLRVPIEKWEGVFVVPVGAVVREGAETYVFRQNGDFYERRTVTVLHEDSAEVVLKDDGALTPRQRVAMSGAGALNRALKALQASGQATNVHVHADGTVHSH